MATPDIDAALMTRFFAPLAGQPVEACALLYLDGTSRIAGARHIVGSVGHIDLSIRTIAADALAFGACSVVMAHNHPSGDPRPSQDDLVFTRQLARGLDALGIWLRDHVILTRDGTASLRDSGVL